MVNTDGLKRPRRAARIDPAKSNLTVAGGGGEGAGQIDWMICSICLSTAPRTATG